MKDKIREITITEVTNGYLVRIGCCVFVFKQDELLGELNGYIREPHETEKRYMKKYGIRVGAEVGMTVIGACGGGGGSQYQTLRHPNEG